MFERTGGDLLSRALRQSTIGAEAFHVRVRDGIGCFILAITTGSSKHTGFLKNGRFNQSAAITDIAFIHLCGCASQRLYRCA